MALEKSSSFTRPPEFRILSPQIPNKSQRLPRPKIPSMRSYFGETFPLSSSRLRTVELHTDNTKNGHGNCIPHPAVSRGWGDSLGKRPQLLFNRPQLSEDECKGLMKRAFGYFVAREAVLDEEIWTASWLRAEARMENFAHRNIECYKKQYAQDEFYALKRRTLGKCGNCLKNFCFVAVRKEEKHIKRTVIKSVVGTLDLSLRQYLKGETYPGELASPFRVFASQDPDDDNKYAYISNVCVAKFARGQDIATNMIYLALDVACFAGMKKLFVHVNETNKIAQGLYKKTGFEFVDVPPLSPVPHSQPFDFPPEERRLLMSMEL